MYFYRYLNHENSLSSFLLVSFSTSRPKFPFYPVLLARDAHAVCPAGTCRVLLERCKSYALQYLRVYNAKVYMIECKVSHYRLQTYHTLSTVSILWPVHTLGRSVEVYSSVDPSTTPLMRSTSVSLKKSILSICKLIYFNNPADDTAAPLFLSPLSLSLSLSPPQFFPPSYRKHSLVLSSSLSQAQD